ncbi:MAG: heme exporter protein CcmD [Alphaproteobacteria bacterium]|nr:heme exporter protein CcmD [Alphaproteobacteria bacterium]
MSDWSTFFEMGGYAAYVWPAYGISILALLLLGMLSWRAMRRSERLVELSQSADSRP